MNFVGRKPFSGRGRRAFAACLAVVVVALTLSGGTAAAGGDILGPVKTAVCRYNASLLSQAYDIFRLQVGRPPADMSELFARQFKRPPKCPAGGEYHFDADGLALCSIHDRPALRVEELGVYRTVPAPGHLPVSVLAFNPRKDAQAVFYARWTPDGLLHNVEVRWLGPDGRSMQVDRLVVRAKSEVSTSLPLRSRPNRLPAGEYEASLVVDGRPAGNCTFWLLE